MPAPGALFALDTLPPTFRALLEVDEVWHALERLDAFLAGVRADNRGEVHPTALLQGPVHVAAGAKVGPYALIEGPSWIGEGAEVGHAAYVRGGSVLLAGSRVGHASEVKRSLLLPGARAPHFNYVGDSIVGFEVNLGAGVKIANFKALGSEIRVGERRTGLRKFGAAVGDQVSIGCNAVLAPGTIVGPRSVIYNGAMVRGIVAADTVVKFRPELEETDLQDRP